MHLESCMHIGKALASGAHKADAQSKVRFQHSRLGRTQHPQVMMAPKHVGPLTEEWFQAVEVKQWKTQRGSQQI